MPQLSGERKDKEENKMKDTNVVAIYDGDLDDEALARLTNTEEMERRREFRRREHRKEKRLQLGIDVAFVAVLCACCFVIGYCVGGWAF